MSQAQNQVTNKEGISEVAITRAVHDIKNLEKRLEGLIEVDKSKVSFGMVVLTSVAHGNYDRALKELDMVGIGFEEYPEFEKRARRYIEHTKGLVYAIKTKHEVGKSPHVNRSKQKELSDRIAEHFIDMKRTLITIEKVQKSVRSSDLSATVMFFKVAFYSAVVVFLFYTAMKSGQYADDISLKDIIGFFTFQWPE